MDETKKKTKPRKSRHFAIDRSQHKIETDRKATETFGDRIEPGQKCYFILSLTRNFRVPQKPIESG